jgi:hypothetical protein
MLYACALNFYEPYFPLWGERGFFFAYNPFKPTFITARFTSAFPTIQFLSLPGWFERISGSKA